MTSPFPMQKSVVRFHYGTVLKLRDGAPMPTLTIKGMPDPLYIRLKQRAAENRRSLNSEILVALEQALASGPPDANALLLRADALRATLRVSPLTDARLDAAKAHGRR
ncbi:MAG: uncharacterized protein JWM95_5348 [Gemmatimonadetes bacterium]|nr:uncharacterized protein [Gemmatimonadota bacterium]